MDKRERVLGMGYLVKSPVKNKDKANFSRFWKLRWCVFVEIVYKCQTGESAEKKKLVFYYYKDKESHQKDESAKGQLQISSCKSIKGCYMSQAGFDHIFKVELDDGSIVKFSAPSCQTKFRWITILYNHKFDANIKPGMGGPFPSHHSIQRKRSTGRVKRFSGCFEEMITMQQRVENLPMTRTLSLNQQCGMMQNGQMQKDPRRDSGRFSIMDGGHCDDAPPLPPRRDTSSVDSLSVMLEDQISICSKISDELETHSPTDVVSPRKSSFGDDKEFGMLQIFNDLFMLCETCQSEAGSGKRGSSIRRRSSTKKMKNFMDEGLTEVEYEDLGERAQNVPSIPDADTVSRDTVSSGESNTNEVESPYSEISEEWLRQVREKTAKLREAAAEENKITSEEDGVNKEDIKANEEPKGIEEHRDDDDDEDDDDDDGDNDDFIYEDMSQFSPGIESGKDEEIGTQDACEIAKANKSESKLAVSGNTSCANDNQTAAKLQSEAEGYKDNTEGEAVIEYIGHNDNNDVCDNAHGLTIQQQNEEVLNQKTDGKQDSKKWEQKIVFQMTM